MHLRKEGITDGKVLSALEKIAREDFIEEHLLDCSYEDRALPIACGQTISQPSIVGIMTEALEVNSRCKILEIGTGSGYQTSILAQLARRVYTIERYNTLMQSALKQFQKYRFSNIVHRVEDGGKGWREQEPFDRIIVTAACLHPPETLLDQLNQETGILVAPIGEEGKNQSLKKFFWKDQKLEVEELCKVRFVPLISDYL